MLLTNFGTELSIRLNEILKLFSPFPSCGGCYALKQADKLSFEYRRGLHTECSTLKGEGNKCSEIFPYFMRHSSLIYLGTGV